MSPFDDSSSEMHDDSLTPDTAERLLDGETPSPELADLVAMVNDVRTAASTTPTPAVRGALAEYVGVGLTATEVSAISPATAALSVDLDLTSAHQPRSRSVFAEVLTFAGTVSGKLLIGGAVAAASITGAQASGLVDVPGLPDKTETVVVADETIDDIPAELPLEDEAEKPNRDETGIDEAEDKATTNDEVDEFSPEKPAVETDDAKDETDEPAKEDDKAEEPKVEEPKAEEAKKNEDKPEKEEPSDYERAVTALEEQLHKDKEAEYAAATELIKPLEADKKALVKALEERLGELERARNEAKAPLYEELETTEDPDRRAEIEAELSAIFEQWELDRDAAIAEAGPAIGDIEQQLETIELERDAEIERLIQQFRADVEALQK